MGTIRVRAITHIGSLSGGILLHFREDEASYLSHIIVAGVAPPG